MRGEATNVATPRAIHAVDRAPVVTARSAAAPISWPFAVAVAGLAIAGLALILST